MGFLIPFWRLFQVRSILHPETSTSTPFLWRQSACRVASSVVPQFSDPERVSSLNRLHDSDILIFALVLPSRYTLPVGFMSEETTTLYDSCVVPWKSGFHIGVGVDCLTGATMQSAIEEISTELTTAPEMDSSRDTMHLCTDLESTSRAFVPYESRALQAYNIAPLHAVVFPDGVDRVLYSPTVFSILVRRDIRSKPSPAAHRYRLTQAATATLEKGKRAFRELFGDFFVAEVQVGSSFEAVIVYVCATPDERSDLVERLARISGASNSNHSTLGAVLEEAKAVTRRVTVHIQMQGTRNDMPRLVHTGQPEDVIMRYLSTFSQNIVPTSVAAHLYSYMILDGGPHRPTLPVPLRVFTELERLRYLLRGCLVIPGALLSFGANETLGRLRDRIKTLQENSNMLQPQLASRDDLRQSLLHEASDVQDEIARFNIAFSIWRNLHSAGSTPPLLVTRSSVAWDIGVIERMGPAFEMESHEFTISVSKHPLSLPWRRALRFAEVTGEELSPPNADDERPQRIIGCSIASRFGRGICQVSDNFLLSTWQRNLPIVVSSGFFRRDEWEIRVSVSRNPYLDALARLPPR